MTLVKREKIIIRNNISSVWARFMRDVAQSLSLPVPAVRSSPCCLFPPRCSLVGPTFCARILIPLIWPLPLVVAPSSVIPIVLVVAGVVPLSVSLSAASPPFSWLPGAVPVVPSISMVVVGVFVVVSSWLLRAFLHQQVRARWLRSSWLLSLCPCRCPWCLRHSHGFLAPFPLFPAFPWWWWGSSSLSPLLVGRRSSTSGRGHAGCGRHVVERMLEPINNENIS
jgi:hypothetical protein